MRPHFPGHGPRYDHGADPGLLALRGRAPAPDLDVARRAAIARPDLRGGVRDPAGHPADALRFRASPFVDPQGDDTFAALQWRLAEVTPGGSAPFQPGRPGRYEAEAIWESGTIDSFTRDILLRRDVVTAGKTYRTRVRMMDATRRWSHWSPPLEFIAGEKRR